VADDPTPTVRIVAQKKGHGVEEEGGPVARTALVIVDLF
jgi:hypothetical protein